MIVQMCKCANYTSLHPYFFSCKTGNPTKLGRGVLQKNYASQPRTFSTGIAVAASSVSLVLFTWFCTISRCLVLEFGSINSDVPTGGKLF